MPHELIAGLEASGVVLLVLLLVPKRGVDHLRARFSDLHSGRRRWLFEPLLPRGDKRAWNVALDAADVFEQGVPLYVAGRLAEHRSDQLNLERQAMFIEDEKSANSTEEWVRTSVRTCAGHPAILCYTIGNEIPASIVRWHGPRRVERWLERFYRIVKAEDPGGLVTFFAEELEVTV